MSKELRHLIIILLFFGFLSSCTSRDKTKIKITDFSEKTTRTIEPYKNDSYAMMNVWVNGFTKDTILIKLGTDESLPILKLSGTISQRWYTDYYGGGNRTLIFDPYKATEGDLEIKFELN
ncbi:hypothetical protein [Urechidicola vernalis]|uniref:Lipoprotein n=1 Tax=Urechidicola vernalis TaxID=3075600 RepID=A0ABU2Y522_9FLAO|nr:hypothetical protein [Urechidicola sp. P050]MDT0552370.1 hypothetical protein [Urechidicola sp. P050]